MHITAYGVQLGFVPKLVFESQETLAMLGEDFVIRHGGHVNDSFVAHG
jgi:hypothetical protein